MSAVVHVATGRDIAAKARRDALIWLRCVTADPSGEHDDIHEAFS